MLPFDSFNLYFYILSLKRNIFFSIILLRLQRSNLSVNGFNSNIQKPKKYPQVFLITHAIKIKLG